MIDPTTAEVLFMGTEAETSGLEAFNAIKDKEGLNDNTIALARTTDILIQLINDGMIEVWLGDPNSREPVHHPGDPLGCKMVTPERLLTMDKPDGRMLVYETTEKGENTLKGPGRESGSFGGWSAERTEQLSIAINEKLSL